MRYGRFIRTQGVVRTGAGRRRHAIAKIGRRPYGRPRGVDRLVERRPMLRLEREGLPDERDEEERRTVEPRDRDDGEVRLTAERRVGVDAERRALAGWRLVEREGVRLELLRPIDRVGVRREPAFMERVMRLRGGLCPIPREALPLVARRSRIERLNRDVADDGERVIERRGVTVVPRLPRDAAVPVRSVTRPRE